MNVIVCLDDNGGMMFNGRRQSQDRALRSKIAEIVGSAKLWMNHYSADQFDVASVQNLNVDDNFLMEAVTGDYCFVENAALAQFERWIERLVVFKWNRVYPSDQVIDMDLGSGAWRLIERTEFEGTSHDRITMEVYAK